MFEKCKLLFIYVESPLHAGTGKGMGAVDLPIQREKTTGYPIIQASSIKGKLRSEARGAIDEPLLSVIFGSEEPGENSYAGALAVGDARLLLFPVRSLSGVFAWVTSLDALARFKRDAKLADLTFDWTLPEVGPTEDQAWINGTSLGDPVVLEEFNFTRDTSHANLVMSIGVSLAEEALPSTPEYKYWRDNLPLKLCILHEDAFRDFVQYGTEVQTHVKLDPVKKTAAGKMLWTSESLPADSLLYSPLLASRSRNSSFIKSGADILIEVQSFLGNECQRTNLGGDETTGQGLVSLTCKGD